MGVVLLGGILVALLTPPRPPSGYLDPANPAGQGTRALAQILGRRGQPVIPVTSAAAAQDAVRDAPGSHPGLVLTSPYLLTAGQLATPGQDARQPAGGGAGQPEPGRPGPAPPGPGAGQPHGSPRHTAHPGPVAGATAGRPVRPGCPLPAAQAAGAAVMGGVLMRDTAPGAWQCYRVDGHSSLVRYQSAGRSVTLLGSGQPLSNAGPGQPG